MGKIDDVTNSFIDWCHRDTAAARLQRTVVQGVLGVGVGLLTMVVDAPQWITLAIIPITMAILTPIMAEIGRDDK